jgi:serine/threonine protein phosphatase PrpC
MEPTSMKTASRTVPGRRSANQDALYVGRLPDGRDLLAVADGMGGHQGGEVASLRAIETLINRLSSGFSLRDAFLEANQAVHAAAHENPAWTGMGTTLVALLRSGDRYHVANVGDSRAYVITPDEIRQITADHSFMAEAIASKKMSAEEAQRSRWRHALTRAIGIEEHVDVDIFGPFEVKQPHTVLLCSDGLHGSLSNQAIQKCVTEIANLSIAAELLADQAYGNGSKDNISVAMVGFGERAQVRVPPKPKVYVVAKPAKLLMTPPDRAQTRSWWTRLFTLFT